MTLAFDTLPCPDSPVRRLDPRWKLAALVVAAVAVAGLRSPPAAVVALLGALGLAALARLPLRWFLGRLGTVAAVLAVFAAALPLLLRGPGPTWQWGPVAFSLYGAGVAVVLCAKALALLTLMLVLLATAPLEATFKAAYALRFPGLPVQLAMLSYRYLFVVADELARLRVALRVRGYRNRASRHCYHTAGTVAGTLLVRSYERAERVGQAMRCRGFDGRFCSLAAFRTTAADVLAFLAVVTAAVGLLAWDVLPR